MPPGSLTTVGLLFVAYLVGAWLLTRLGTRLRSIGFIKAVHLAIFILVSILLAGFLYEVLTGRLSALTWGTIGILLGEGLVLATNRWRCPLTDVTEGLGSDHGQVTDILLPKWLADRVWIFYTWLFAGGLLVLAFRVFG